MRLIECITRDHTGKTDSTIDLDKVDVVHLNIDENAIFVFSGGYMVTTDIPYEKAVALWENYQPQKGVTAKFD